MSDTACTTDPKQEQQLTLTYDDKLEEFSHLDAYYHRVSNELRDVIKEKLKVKKILLTTYNVKYISKFTSLIPVALLSRVEELHLLYSFCWLPGSTIELNESLFNNEHLTHLNLCCNFTHPTLINWENLKWLSLSNLSLTEEFLQKILSGGPLLETLKLNNCYGDLWHLNITSNSVKSLEISGNSQFRDGHTSVSLKAPSITSLTIKGSLVLYQLVVLDATSLLEANLDYCIEEDDTGRFLTPDEEEEMIYRHVELLRGVKDLKLGTRCSEVLSRLEAKGSCQEDYYNEYLEDLWAIMMKM